MPRPTTKNELIRVATIQFDKLWDLIESMTYDEQITNFNFDALSLGKEQHWKRDKNIRDVLIHLYEWHQLLLSWITTNKDGVHTSFLPTPYNWKNYGEMNIGFFEKHQRTPYAISKEMLKESHHNVIVLIDTFSNEELFTKKQFSWTGTTTLGSYCVSASSSHYDWAIKKVKKHRMTLANCSIAEQEAL